MKPNISPVAHAKKRRFILEELQLHLNFWRGSLFRACRHGAVVPEVHEGSEHANKVMGPDAVMILDHFDGDLEDPKGGSIVAGGIALSEAIKGLFTPDHDVLAVPGVEITSNQSRKILRLR